MEKTIMAILVNKRKEQAVQVQKVLTEWGCLIKTRLGVHDGVLGDCSNCGLIILELVGSSEQIGRFKDKMNVLPGVRADLITLTLED